MKAGDEILAVDGVTVGKRVSLEERMSSLAGEDVRLTVRSGKTSPGVKSRKKPSPGTTRTVTIRALGDETPLRYRDWVETNRALVHEASKGRVGYVHIPNMGPLGYAEFHRYYIQEVDNDGLLIDVRFNGGGHVSQLLLEKLLRKRIGYGMPRWGSPDSYPEDAPRGPMVALTNEYAGSDGDIFSHAFKLYGLGPLLGKRTWGGVVGIWPRASLVDGTVTTQAEYATWFNDVGWGVENYGTDPDIDVEILPQDYAAGRDPQIERAIKETLKLVRSGPRRDPKMAKAPSLRPARLKKQKR